MKFLSNVHRTGQISNGCKATNETAEVSHRTVGQPMYYISHVKNMTELENDAAHVKEDSCYVGRCKQREK